MIRIIENVLSKSEVAQYLAHLQQTQHWEDGKATAGDLASQAKQNQQLAENSEIAISLGNHLLRKLGELAPFISFALPEKIYPPRFNRYQQSQHYGFHVDSAVMQMPAGQQSLRTDLSATLFLTEPDEYEGGALEIKQGEALQTIKLPAGSMVVYPANTLHQVTPVVAGVRVSAFFWVQSMVKNHEQRLLLHELDQSIQNLTRLRQDAAEIQNLSKVYHNLLRQWAIV